MVTMTERPARLPRHLLQRGWSAEVEDICWLACPEPGHRLVKGNHEIILCIDHIKELELTSEGGGYSAAQPPRDGGELILVDADQVIGDDGSVVLINKVYEEWWPWVLLNQPDD